MTFDRFSFLALLAVTLLAATVYGHPITDISSESLVEPSTEKFVNEWIKEIKTCVNNYKQNIKDGFGVVNWVKNKFGLSTTNTNTDLGTTPDNFDSTEHTIVYGQQYESTLIPNYGINYGMNEVNNAAATEVNSNVYYDSPQ